MPKRDKALAAFGRNVAKFRTERGLSQDKLAGQANLDRTYVSGIKRAVRNPEFTVVITPARVLKVGTNEQQSLSLHAETRFYIDPQADKVRAVNAPGDLNRNNQQLLRLTAERGTDYNARVVVLKCQRCSHIYGSNSTDAFERKCPHCREGKPGLAIPTERDREAWTREEHVIAFQLYSRIPFGTIHMRNPEVIELAALLGRKVGSASRKLANFSRLDPVHQARDVRGLEHGSKGEAEVWHEFEECPEALVFESARLLAERLGYKVEQVAEIKESDLPPPGIERDALVKLRVNQSFFRQRVLSAYESRCCVTGLTTRPLLVASHIVPWAEDAKNRLNPRNGLCLNALHDRAFDRNLMWIEPNFIVKLSPNIHRVTAKSNETVDWLLSFDGKQLLFPESFQPDRELLARHASNALRGGSSLQTLTDLAT